MLACINQLILFKLYLSFSQLASCKFEPGDTENAGVAMRSKANTVNRHCSSSFPDLFALEYEDYTWMRYLN